VICATLAVFSGHNTPSAKADDAGNQGFPEKNMSRLTLGAICGVVFGAGVVLMMLPMEFPDKTAALAGAFLNRFGVGFVIGAAKLPVPGWAQGMIFGLLLSLPDAIITKAYAPILILGLIGGALIGLIVDRWGK
jgi:hypothetical protein